MSQEVDGNEIVKTEPLESEESEPDEECSENVVVFLKQLLLPDIATIVVSYIPVCEFKCDCNQCGRFGCERTHRSCVTCKGNSCHGCENKCEMCHNTSICPQCMCSCKICDDPICVTCADHCATCKSDAVCGVCAHMCTQCGITICHECVQECDHCSAIMRCCRDCSQVCSFCGDNICESCALTCENCEAIVCKSHARNCVSCDKIRCKTCGPLQSCDNCHERCCTNCIESCTDCDADCCTNCFSDHECESEEEEIDEPANKKQRR